jgi:hypothetical protein
LGGVPASGLGGVPVFCPGAFVVDWAEIAGPHSAKPRPNTTTAETHFRHVIEE